MRCGDTGAGSTWIQSFLAEHFPGDPFLLTPHRNAPVLSDNLSGTAVEGGGDVGVPMTREGTFPRGRWVLPVLLPGDTAA